MVASKKSPNKPKSVPKKKTAKLKPGVAAEQPIMATLRAEHKHIAQVLELFSRQLQSVEADEWVDAHILYETMDYMVCWPDRFHHPREDLIYDRVAEVSPAAAAGVADLLREHQQMGVSSRQLLANIDRWRDGDISSDAMIEEGRTYIDKMYEHMNTEEDKVFPQIETVLSLEDWRDLAAHDRLKPQADPIFSGRIDREFRNLARKLRRDLRRTAKKGAMTEWVDMEALLEGIEVMEMAYEAARDATGDHFRAAWDESIKILRETPVTSVFRCAANNTRLTVSWAGDVLGISKDTLKDLYRVNQVRRERVSSLDQAVR